MDENLTSKASSRIPGDGQILSRFKSSRNPLQNLMTTTALGKDETDEEWQPDGGAFPPSEGP